MNTQQAALATQARRPVASDYRPLGELTVGELLEDPRVRQAMSDAAPQHLNPQRLLRVMAQALRKTPKLALCHPLSLLGAMITCASLGLEPNTPLQHVHLIPFEKKKKDATGKWVTDYYEINLIIGYQGYIDLSRRTGSLVSIHADVVYAGDDFSFEYGSNMHLRHVPKGAREGRMPSHAYAHAKLEDGEAFEVLPYADVLKIRNNAQAYKQALVSRDKGYSGWETTPWIAYEHEMAAKTMVRRLSKWLPKSIEFATAVQMDSLAERGLIDFRAIADQPALVHDPESVATIEEQPTEAKPPEQPAENKAPPKERKNKAKEADKAAPPPAEAETPPADGWDDKLAKRLADYSAAGDSGKAELNAAFRDSVVGAFERKEIPEKRANELLEAWQQKTGTGPKA